MPHSPLTFQQLAEKLNQFDADRKWLDLSPEDLAKSIMIEGAELLEHFQWDDTLRKKGNPVPEKDLEKIGSEVADVLVYLMKFCREMNIDIVEATLKKIDKVDKKYPVGHNDSANGNDLNHEEYLRIKHQHRSEKN